MLFLQNTKFKIFKDFTLNLIASIVSTGILQLLLYPFLATYMSTERYGIALTVMGVGNTIGAAFGGSLNNTRLLQNTQYVSDSVVGDFPILGYSFAVIGCVAMFLYMLTDQSMNRMTRILLSLFVFATIIRNYAGVAYQIVIDYKKNLFFNCAVGAEEIAGIVILFFSQKQELWPLPFAIGELAGILFLAFTSTILTERFALTFHIKKH